MGSRGPAPKPRGEAVGHRKRNVVELHPVEGREIPPAPSGMLATVREKWERYWRSEVAQVATEVDEFKVSRYFLYLDEWERCTREFRKQRFIEGAAGQARISPYARYILDVEKQIQRLETDLGLSPLARSRLGIALGQASLTVAELNRMANGNEDEEQPSVEAEIVEGWEEA